MKKKTLLLIIILMVVGFAAVSTTLYINGQTKIAANQDDFDVYYSNALVNGVQDLSVITDDTNITFTTTLETLGEKYVLDYDVTNGSKNYDAELVMECTQGNDYLTVTNEFDTTTNLEALKTRSGKLTLELIKSYAGDEDLDVTITCTIDANAIERTSLGEGVPAVDPYAVGTEITLAGEKFNIISSTEDTVTMLAHYSLGPDYRQTELIDVADYGVRFAEVNGWEYTPGPKEIDIQTWSPNVSTYVNEYVSYLQTETGTTSISGNLITLTELGKLGCLISADYSYTSQLTCENSPNVSWLVNGQNWWTRSPFSNADNFVWLVRFNGKLTDDYFYRGTDMGVRPVITIDKADLS